MKAQPQLIEEQPSPTESRETTLAPSTDVSMFERLAKDPAVDVDKLERLIAMQERILKHQAKAAFARHLARMQSELPEVSERGQILVNGQLRSTYAKLEDIHAQIRPILRKHGFAIRHRTEWPQDRAGIIRIVGILSHEHGHSEESSFEAPADKSNYRTDIQSMGSTVSYGRRYTTLDLLNIATRGQDDDGQKSGRPQAPEGYDDWLADIACVADEGTARFSATWDKSKVEYRNFLVQHERPKWEELKRKAATVTAEAKKAGPR